ncbi:MAG: AMP-binding protein, partial [bacterium]|nr:AMP-binding protein [bacterium]
DGVARGYLNRPELTAQRFVQNPYKPGERLYRSGDLGKLSADGDIEYLGRIDRQVKVRGYRIETGEIETQLLSHDEVNEAVVLLRSDENDDRSLCAYLVGSIPLGNGGIPLLKEHLSRSLPDYMIPSYFIGIDKIPLTSNGKIDRKALAGYAVSSSSPRTSRVEPANETEEKLVAIWKDVLGIEEVGTDENFFNVGGDSIKAIRLVSVANNVFKSNLKVVDIFTGNTIREIADLLTGETVVHDDEDMKKARRQIEALRAKVLNSDKMPANVEGIYPMSDIEKGMTFHAYSSLDVALYHDQFIYQRKYADFEPGTLKKALQLLMDKHPILRTSFNVDDFNDFVHFVHYDCPVAYTHFDLTGLEKQQQEETIKEHMAKDRGNPWDVKSPPLWRLGIFSLASDHICGVWTFHHAILDGWSNASFMTELNNTYLRLKADKTYVPEPLKITHEQFALGEIVEKNKAENIDFWKKDLDGYKRTVFPGYAGEGNEISGVSGKHDHRLLETLKQTSKKHKTNLKHLCFAAYVAMISMLSHENDVVVGLVSNSRPEYEDGDKLLGCFLNTLPFRLKIPGNITWREYIQRVESKLVQLKRYDKITFLEIVRIIGERNRTGNPVFDTIFSYTDFHVYRDVVRDDIESADANDGERQLTLQGYERTNTLFDFKTNITPRGMSMEIIYATAIVSHETVKKLFGYFDAIIALMIDSPDQILRKNDILSPQEKQRLLEAFNNTAQEFPRDKTIHTIIREQAQKAPDQPALVGTNPGTPHQTHRLTYRQLEEKSGLLAHRLRENGVGPDVIAAIMVESPLEMITGIMGILKAGGAYLPISPGYPADRVRYMLSDSSAPVLVTSEEVKKLRRSEVKWEIATICVNPMERLPNSPSQQPLNLSTSTPPVPSNVAYVIYTSGSTGRPKGVMVEHRSLVNLCTWHNREYSVTPADHAAQYAGFVFDASVWEIFPYLAVGASIYPIPASIKLDMEQLNRYFEQNDISITFLPTQVCEQFIKVANSSLRVLLTGGDKLNQWVEVNYRLVNNY